CGRYADFGGARSPHAAEAPHRLSAIMNYQLVLSHTASRALEEGLVWWAEHRSAEQSFRWHAGFLDALKKLEHEPMRFPLAPANGLVDFEVRELHFGLGTRATHRALFTISGSIVRVLHIRQAAQAVLQRDDLLP